MEWRDETIRINRVRALRGATTVETSRERQFKAVRARLRVAHPYLALAAIGAFAGYFGAYTVVSTASVAQEIKNVVVESNRATAEQRVVERAEGQIRQRIVKSILNRDR